MEVARSAHPCPTRSPGCSAFAGCLDDRAFGRFVSFDAASRASALPPHDAHRRDRPSHAMGVTQSCRTRIDLVGPRRGQHDHRRQTLDCNSWSRTLDSPRRRPRRSGESSRGVSSDTCHARIVDSPMDRTLHRDVDRCRTSTADSSRTHDNACRATSSGTASLHRSAHSHFGPALRRSHSS